MKSPVIAVEFVKIFCQPLGSAGSARFVFRHLGWMERVTATTLRFRLFTTGGILSQTAGVTTIRLAVREAAERIWWRRMLEKMVSLIPNCNSVAQSS